MSERWLGFLTAVVFLGLSACGGDGGGPGAGGDDDPADSDGKSGAKDQGDDDASDPSGGSAGDDEDGAGGAAGSGGSKPTMGAPAQDPTFLPAFPGAGTSDAGEPLQNGMLCDAVDLEGEFPTPDEVTQCFFDVNDTDRSVPAATLEQVLECVEEQDVIHLRLTFNPGFVDNTYGAGSIGWPPKRGHRFSDLTKSDHAEIVVHDNSGEAVLQFKLDYITEDPAAPSGFGSLGVSGGDGSVSVGDAAWVIDYATSLDRNLNERGYGEYTIDSPATDEDFSPNPETPEWDYRMVYEVWIDVAALGGDGFGGAYIEYVHASPAKGGNDTLEVEPGECPPDFCRDPDGCYDGPGDECVPGGPDDTKCSDEPPPPPPPDDECTEDRPDDVCGTGGEPPDPGDPEFCKVFPDDPRCKVD